MGAFPTSRRAALLQWCEAHTLVFATHTAEIGLSPEQATAFATATSTAAAALLAQEQARQAALAATQTAADAIAALRSSAGDTVRLIRAFAEASADPAAVYVIAQIPAPADPSPLPPPGQPTDLTVTLTPADGALRLRWKVTNPPGACGTSYIIRRRLPSEGEFSFVGVSGKKEFVDETLIAGPDSVQYTVQGQRSDSSGPLSEIFTVNFGRLPTGQMTASVYGGGLAASPSTVAGRVVQKVLPSGNGSPAAGAGRL